MSANLPRFISEKEVTERRLRNEAEGIKEEPYDPRSLYDRLQVRRVSNSDQDPKRLHTSSPEPNELVEQVESNPKVAGSMTTETGPVEARVLAGFLPGLDAYTGSTSDSSSDSSTDVEDSAQTLDVIAVTRTKSASSGGE
ncbi:hypothetical protein SprV_0501831300 [Sparganum proliferum]